MLQTGSLTDMHTQYICRHVHALKYSSCTGRSYALKRQVSLTDNQCRDKLLGASQSEQHQANGSAFTLSVARQSNIIVVVTRAVQSENVEELTEAFGGSAEQAATAAGYLFDATSRAQRGMTLI